MKIGIMGGTFDPIHIGHLLLGEFAYENFQLDEIWFLPNGNPPHKDNKNIVSTPRERAYMVSLAISGHRNFRLEDYELRRKDVSCSYRTMEYFKKLYPQDHFYFIIGADSLFSLEQWVHVERLFPTCTLLAAFRGDKSSREVMDRQIQLLTEKYDADIRLLSTPLVDISSHELRRMLKDHENVDGLMPRAVVDYIQKKQLYASQ